MSACVYAPSHALTGCARVSKSARASQLPVITGWQQIHLLTIIALLFDNAIAVGIKSEWCLSYHAVS